MRSALFKTFIVIWYLTATPLSFAADTPAANKPLVSHVYSADPSAHVFNKTLYIYGSHDQSADCVYGNIVDCFDMKDYFVMSMDSTLSNTKVHDTALKLEDIPWATNKLWAPDAAFANGKYYLYFPAKNKHNEFQIGVAVGDKPEGPFLPQPLPITGSYSIDPSVFKDDDGSHYLYFGGIGAGNLQHHGHLSQAQISQLNDLELAAVAPRVAKLTDDMLQFAEQPKEVLILDEHGEAIKANDLDRRFFEAAWLHKYQDQYYFSYSTGETHFLVYAISDNPYGPFTYAGKILEPVIGWTTHHSIVEYQGQWTLFYHDSQLSGGITYQRTIKMMRLNYDDKGRIITMTPP